MDLCGLGGFYDFIRFGDVKVTESVEETIWCVVANVKQQVPYGSGGKELKNGLKHFRGGAKLYVIGAYAGLCDNLIVIGQHRKSRKYTRCVIKVNSIENIRVKQIYSPKVIELATSFKGHGAHISIDEESAAELANLIPLWIQNL